MSVLQIQFLFLLDVSRPMEVCPPKIVVPAGLDILKTFDETTSLFISRHPFNRIVSYYFNYLNTAAKGNEKEWS